MTINYKTIVHILLLLGDLGLVLVLLVQSQLKPLLQYGKTATRPQDGQHSLGLVRRISAVAVPKRYFSHFYNASVLVGGLCLWFATRWQSTESWSRRTALINLGLMMSHSLRRRHESISNSNSPMWIGHYLAGLFFYTVVNVGMLFEAGEVQLIWAPAFFLAQAVQHLLHMQLESMRKACEPGTYANPKDGLFRVLVAPHYTAEVVLYLSLALMNGSNVTLWLVAIWTILILSMSAQQTDDWGRATFADWRPRYKLLPFIF